MVLNVHSQPLVTWIEGWPFRNGPAQKRAVPLETQIVMVAPCYVVLYDEPETVGRIDRRRTRSAFDPLGLGCAVEAPLSVVRFELCVHGRIGPSSASGAAGSRWLTTRLYCFESDAWLGMVASAIRRQCALVSPLPSGREFFGSTSLQWEAHVRYGGLCIAGNPRIGLDEAGLYLCVVGEADGM